MTLNPDGHFTRDALRRALHAGTGALALSLLAAGCSGGGDASPTASGAATTGPITAPTVSSSASVDIPLVFTLHPNFFPAKQAEAKDIPWDQVGPGWFLVDSRVRANDDFLNEDGFGRMPEAVGGLSLVSPDGQWYAARSFAGTGAAFSLHWAADGVWLMTAADESIEEVYGDIVRVDLKTGVKSSVANGQVEAFAYAGAADGITLVSDYSQEAATDYLVYGPGGVANTTCALRTVFGEIRFLIAPDGTRVGCWGFRSDNKTDVGVLDLRTPSTIDNLDVFSRDAYSYEILGWVSDDTFLLARSGADGSQEAFFAYDVSTRTIADFPLPFALGADDWVQAFDFTTQVFVSSGSTDGLQVHRADGTLVATVPAGCRGHGGWTSNNRELGGWTLSGDRLLAFCGDEERLVMINLATDAVVGTWESGAGLDVRTYGYPEHTD